MCGPSTVLCTSKTMYEIGKHMHNKASLNYCQVNVQYKIEWKEFFATVFFTNKNKRAMMALDRLPDLCNVICHANCTVNHINSFCGQVS